MKGTLGLLFILCLATVCLANKQRTKNQSSKKNIKTESAKVDEEGKVEVLTEDKAAVKTKKTTQKENSDVEEENDETSEEDDEQAETEDDEEEEEEEDPNAKVDVQDLYVPKECKNRTRSGDQVVVHYTGWMQDGSLFDTTIDQRKGYQPFEFILGSGTVIKGFEKALTGMCRLQRRKVVIPPALAYGKKGTTDIPGTN